ncbi:MAG: PIN domain-containing protein [Campylobacterales bacterium]|nr:PIN domain-containing protein [Campylobacterales bacterium]
MVYLDTNVLIYASINQEATKHTDSINLIEKLVNEEKLILSPLVIQEFIFTLAKLKIDKNTIQEDVNFYMNFIASNYTKTMLQEAFAICIEDDKCTSINDILHLKIATQEATKLITYDRYFKNLQKYSSIEIVVL